VEKIIIAKDIVKKYKVGNEIITALNGVNIEIEKGEFVAILGTSGSGKSTLLNMLAGLERPTKGDIFINGTHLNKVNEKNMAKFRAKQMGFIFQAYNLIPSFTALENVTLPLIFQGYNKKKREKMAEKILIEMGLEKRLHNKPNQMSGGQQQRVSIARSLVNDPKIIFADEPTGNLDSHTTKEILEYLQRIVHENGRTLIMVSHDMEVAEYADRIIRMTDGMIVEEIKMNNRLAEKDKENIAEQTEETHKTDVKLATTKKDAGANKEAITETIKEEV